MLVPPQRFRFQRPTDSCYPNRQYQLLVYFRAASVFSTVMESSLQLACVFSFHAVTGLFPSSLEKKGVSRHMDKAAQTLPEAPPTGIKGGV